MGDGDPDSFVNAPPSLFSKSKPARVGDWCRDQRAQTDYRLHELGQAGLGFLLIVVAFTPAIIIIIMHNRHERKFIPKDENGNLMAYDWQPHYAMLAKLKKAQKWAFAGAVIGLNLITIASCLG
jgi:hypothetical protein